MTHAIRIAFCPVRSDGVLTLEKTGEGLVINGCPFDLAAATPKRPLVRDVVGCDWILSDVTRAGGILCLTLALPHGAGAVCDDPAGLVLTLDADGPVTLPHLVVPMVGPASDDDIPPPFSFPV